MTKDEVQKALRDEEARRRAAAAKREEEILALMEEQRADEAGKLWGETPMDSLGYENEARTDTEARFVPAPEKYNPERILIKKEFYENVFSFITKNFGTGTYQVFLDWLDHATVAELAVERNQSFQALLRLIKQVVAELRRIHHRDPKFFPFLEPVPEDVKRLNKKIAHARMMANLSPVVDESKRVHLSEQEREIPLDKLVKHLREKGYSITRSTAYRAKKRGWFYPEYQTTTGVSFGPKVELTPEEIALSVKAISERFGISNTAANKAKKSGFFTVTMNIRDTVIIPADRSILPAPALPDRVELTAEERKSSAALVAECYGITRQTAQKAIQRGWFAINSENRDKVRLPKKLMFPRSRRS